MATLPKPPSHHGHDRPESPAIREFQEAAERLQNIQQDRITPSARMRFWDKSAFGLMKLTAQNISGLNKIGTVLSRSGVAIMVLTILSAFLLPGLAAGPVIGLSLVTGLSLSGTGETARMYAKELKYALNRAERDKSMLEAQIKSGIDARARGLFKPAICDFSVATKHKNLQTLAVGTLKVGKNNSPPFKL